MSTRADDLHATALAFVAEAQRMTNERDVDGIRHVFARDGHQTAVLDGLLIQSRGIDEIHGAWRTMCAFMARRRMYVEKTLVAATGRTVVNEWTGTVAGKQSARGIEVWTLDNHGLVTNQRLYGFLDARTERSPIANLRMLAAHPVTAVSFARAKSER